MADTILRIGPDTVLPDQAGGKARGLQLIAAAGFPLLPTWVVLPGASAASIEAFSTELVRSRQGLLAVRSSARDEDDERHSFAGIHESRLGVRADELPEAIARVAASTLSDRARAYREQMGLPAPQDPCAVVVQELVPSECAGIALGTHTENGSERILIEAVAGLGETAVEGRVVPETSLMVHASGQWQLARRTPRTQAVTTVVRGDHVASVRLSRDRRHGDLLDTVRATAIAESVARLQRMAGKALDVEWAWARGVLWLLQARPRTKALTDTLPPGEIWTRVNVREVLPDIPSAFARSTIGVAIDAAERDILRSYGIRPDPAIPIVTFVYGRPVFNVRAFVMADLLGVAPGMVQAEFGGSSEADDAVTSLDSARALRHPLVLVRAAIVAVTAARRAQRFIVRLREIRNEIASIDPSVATDRLLLDAVLDVQRRVPRRWAFHAVSVAGAIANAQFPVLMRVRHHAPPWALLARLVADGEASVSTQQLDDLLALAEAMRAWPGAATFAATVTPDHSAAGYWRDRLPGDLWNRVERWLDQYGHRGPFESDIAAPRYADDLTLLGRALFPLLSGPAPATVAESRDRRRAEAAQAWAEVERRCGRRARRRTEADLRRVKRLMALRERLRSEATAVILPLRRAMLELGRRLVANGRLGHPADIWHLSLEELQRTFTEPGFAADVAVARELARRMAWGRFDVPNRFTSEEVAAMPVPRPEADAEMSMLRGNGVSPGIVEGPVRVLWSPTDSDRFSTGAVLVAPATDPGWTPLFARAVGVIVELGGALSHAGIVAREYGIPCVANIDGITRVLQDDDVVRIDGSSGVVTVVSRAPVSNGPVSDPSRRVLSDGSTNRSGGSW